MRLLAEIGQGVVAELLERDARIAVDRPLQRIEKAMEGRGIMGDLAPERQLC